LFERRSDWIWLLVFIVVLIIVSPMLGWGILGGYMPGMMGMMGPGWVSILPWGSMILFPIAFLLLITVGAYYLIAGFMGTNRSTVSEGGRALEILKERYAKGEITTEQYSKMREGVRS